MVWSALEELMEKVGMYAMEKKTVSVEDIKENFSLEKNRQSRWSVSLRESVCLPKRITDITRSSWIRMPFLTVSEAIRSWHSVCRP